MKARRKKAPRSMPGFCPERALIALVVDRWPEVRGAVDALAPEDFEAPTHALLFSAAVALEIAGAEVDLCSVVAEIERAGDAVRFRSVGGVGPYLAELLALQPVAAMAPEYVRRVRALARQRALVRAGVALVGHLQAGRTMAALRVAAVVRESLEKREVTR